MSDEIREKIESLVAQKPDLEVVDIRFKGSGGQTVVQILLDKESGIGLDDLTAANRMIGNAMDQWDYFKGKWTLEVSSAGVERPLTKIEHFQKFVGKKVKVQLIEPLDENRRKIQGYIKDVHGENILIDADSQEISVMFSNIKKANLVFEM